MKARALILPIILLGVMLGNVEGQIKGPRDYFPKKYPAPGPGGTPPPPPPASPANRNPASAQPLKFKDLSTNSVFYFVSDTNRAVGWTKITARAAKNNRSGTTQTISAETRVVR